MPSIDFRVQNTCLNQQSNDFFFVESSCSMKRSFVKLIASLDCCVETGAVAVGRRRVIEDFIIGASFITRSVAVDGTTRYLYKHDVSKPTRIVQQRSSIRLIFPQHCLTRTFISSTRVTSHANHLIRTERNVRTSGLAVTNGTTLSNLPDRACPTTSSNSRCCGVAGDEAILSLSRRCPFG